MISGRIIHIPQRFFQLLTLLLSATLLMPLLSEAAPPQDSPPIPGAKLEATTAIDSPNHRILLSSLREVDNEIRADRQVRLAAKGTGSLYRLDQDSSIERAREQYRSLLLQNGAHILFECEGLSCGPSNAWANEVFHQSMLYGPDDGQGASVAAFRNDAGFLQLWVSYTIRRVNQRGYLWLERLEIDNAAGIPGVDLSPQRLRGPVIVHWSGSVTQRFDWSSRTRGRVVSWARKPDAAMILTSHSTLKPDESVSESFRRAREAGESMQALLENLGVPLSKQIVINNGPAIARSDNSSLRGNRIEIVVIEDAGSIKDL